MSISPEEAAMEEALDRLAEELYEEHKYRAIDEFISERLTSYYVANPMIMRPAVEAIQEGRQLQANGHSAAALIFFVTAIEILLKATLLRPVLYGLVHNEAVAEILVQEAVKQSGFDRYEKLISNLFEELVGLKLVEVSRDGSRMPILSECKALQKVRNNIIHKGANCAESEAENARSIAVAVFEKVVRPVLYRIGVDVVEKGHIIAT